MIQKLSAAARSFYSELREAEVVVLLALFLAQFSLWPSVGVPGFSSSSFEPAMLSGLVLVVYGLKKYGRELARDLLASPFIWMFMWFVYALAVAVGTTDRMTYVVVRGILILSVVFGGFVVVQAHKAKDIRITKVMDGWAYLILAMSPLFLLQYLFASVGIDAVAKEAYQVGVFDFPRLHGFSFEPLFFANWTLAPTIYLLYRSRERAALFWPATILSLLLFLTLARGAIYGLIVAMIFLFVISRSKKRLSQSLRPLAIGLLIAFVFVGFSAFANNANPIHGIGRFMDHMANGLFNTAGSSSQEVRIVEFTDRDGNVVTRSFVDLQSLDSEGAVEGSAISRLEAIRTGIDVFEEQPLTGSGLLRFGEEAQELYPTIHTNRDIVTNSLLVDLLVEGGIIGALLLLAFAFSALKQKPNVRNLAVVMGLALATQSLFFSNYSILPFWIMLGIAMNDVDKSFKVD